MIDKDNGEWKLEDGKCYNCGEEATESIYCSDCAAVPKCILSEEEVTNIAEDVLNVTFSKAIEKLRGNFYTKIQDNLYKHSNSYRDKIMQEALDLIIGKSWAKYRNDYDMKELRDRIYKEHKDEFDKKITSEVVEEEIHRYFNLMLTDSEKTGWQNIPFEEKVISWICNNYEKSKILQEKLPQELLKKNKEQKEAIASLIKRLEDIENFVGGQDE